MRFCKSVACVERLYDNHSTEWMNVRTEAFLLFVFDNIQLFSVMRCSENPTWLDVLAHIQLVFKCTSFYSFLCQNSATNCNNMIDVLKCGRMGHSIE